MSVTEAKTFEEKQILVNGVTINYVKVGGGPHIVLMLTGTIATWNRFIRQIEYLDKNEVTMIAWDPPGCGKSRPPDKSLKENYLEKDAKCAHEFMKLLGYSRYSVIGWCTGGTTALFMTRTNPECIRKLVLISTPVYITKNDYQIHYFLSDLDKWQEHRKQRVVAEFGEEYLRKLLREWGELFRRLYENGGNICREILPEICRPTLIIHGDKDVLTQVEQAFYLGDHIPNAKLKIVKNASHDLMWMFHDEINPVIKEFLSSDLDT